MTQVEVLVEVGVATARPPRTHAFAYVWLTIERIDRYNVAYEAETTAAHMVMCHPHVVMVTSTSVIDWKEPT